MAFARKIKAEGEWLRIGTTTRKLEGKDTTVVVRLKVRRLTRAEALKCRQEAYGRLKARQLVNAVATAALDRAEAETIERAIVELLDSENFTTEPVEGEEAIYSKALGRDVKAGDEVLLDGHWTDDVKRNVFEGIDRLAARVDRGVSNLQVAGMEEEEETLQDF